VVGFNRTQVRSHRQKMQSWAASFGGGVDSAEYRYQQAPQEETDGLLSACVSVESAVVGGEASRSRIPIGREGALLSADDQSSFGGIDLSLKSRSSRRRAAEDHAHPPETPSCIRSLWFGAALFALVGGLFGALELLFTSFRPMDIVELAYIFLLGSVMVVVDLPLSSPSIRSAKEDVRNYAMLFTRIFGRGITYTFLGATLFSSFWECHISRALAVIFGLSVFGVGLVTIVYTCTKSRRLWRVHGQVVSLREKQHLKLSYERFAASTPKCGLTQAEFSSFSRSLKAEEFDTDDLEFIFLALSGCPSREYVSQEDLMRWADGSGWVFL